MFQNNKFRIGNKDLSNLLKEAIEIYNSYRGKESNARVLKIEGDEVWVLFEGHFCYTCGVNDWVEDFAYVLKDLGIEAHLDKILEPEQYEEPWRIGIFKIRGVEGNERGV
ncbi:MAG: hypothetical protein QW632_04330 [Ignisphaera sp.]